MPTASRVREVSFMSHDVLLRAGYWKAAHAAFKRPAGLPCIVMAHGLGGTRAAGLAPYAEAFAAAGFEVLCFDYRGFGESGGEPRQVVDVEMQLEDWAAAIAHARSLKGVDGKRIALWGSSFSGGHAVAAAVRDGKVAAVSNQGGMLDGLAAVQFLVKQEGVKQVARVMRYVLADALAAVTGRPRVMLPVVGEPGSLAVLTAPDSKPGFLAIAPPDWRNEISLSWMLKLALYRPNVMAAKLHCPTLFCIAEKDSAVPPSAVEDAARRAGARAEVRRYALGHFEIYVGEGFRLSSGDQVAFFSRVLAA